MAVAAVLCLLVAADWEVARDDGRNLIERRARPDGFMEIRASTVTDVPTKHVAETFWARRGRSVSAVKKYVVISKTEDTKVIYQQLKLPVVKDRDYTVSVRRYVDDAHGLYQFNSVCASELGPPPNDEHVRVTNCRTEISMERGEDGRTHITYVTFADTAGRLPKWIVNLLAPKAAAEFMDHLVDEAREAMALNDSKADSKEGGPK